MRTAYSRCSVAHVTRCVPSALAPPPPNAMPVEMRAMYLRTVMKWGMSQLSMDSYKTPLEVFYDACLCKCSSVSYMHKCTYTYTHTRMHTTYTHTYIHVHFVIFESHNFHSFMESSQTMKITSAKCFSTSNPLKFFSLKCSAIRHLYMALA